MAQEDVKPNAPAVAPSFLANTANTLAEILASQNKFEKPLGQSTSETADTETTNIETSHTETAIPSSPSESSKTSQNSMADHETRVREKSPSPRPTTPTMPTDNDVPEIPYTDSEDIECQTCRQIKSKYDFSMDQRETYPDCVSTRQIVQQQHTCSKSSKLPYSLLYISVHKSPHLLLLLH